MVKRLAQTAFSEAPFDSDSFNLHASPQPRRSVVIAVHGLGGHGYGTWGQLLPNMYAGTDGEAVDIAVYDYVSGPRRLQGHNTKPDFWVAQLADHIRQLADRYEHIFLLGHSLGGIVAEEAVMALVQMQRLAAGTDTDGNKATAALAALIFVASPRTGSAAALPPLRWLLPELRVLKPFQRRRRKTLEFFNAYVERMNVATAAAGRLVLPTFAAVAGSDRLVKACSATFDVPPMQRKQLTAGHRTAIRPVAPDDQALLTWLQDVIAACIGVREQARREQHHAGQVRIPQAQPLDDGIVTAFRSDPGGSHWELLYNEARSAASATTAVTDVRDVAGRHADLVIAVHDAHVVLQPQPGAEHFMRTVCAERDTWPHAVIGVAPVGARHTDAQAALMATAPAVNNTSVYVEGAPGPDDLRHVLARWFQLVLSRDLRRRRPFDVSQTAVDSESTWNGGTS